MSKFWGLTVCVGKKFKQHVQEGFCISGAALEPTDGASGKYDEKPIQLYVQHENNDHLLCSLAPNQGVLQVMLNARIGSGETIGFHLKGGSPKSKLHLTGYTLPRDNTATPPAALSFQKLPKSILVSDRKGDAAAAAAAAKKRVSIMESEPSYGEREMESDSSNDEDEDEETEVNHSDIKKNLFVNGGNSIGESDDSSDDGLDDDDDDDDDDADSDLDEEELAELQQLLKKGQYDPKTGGKKAKDAKDDDDEDDSDDSDLQLLDGDDDDDTSDDSDDGLGDTSFNKSELGKKKSKKQMKQLNSATKVSEDDPSLTKKQKNQGTPNKEKKNESGTTPKTPENQHLKIKAPSSAGHTPMKTFTKGGVLCNDIKVGNGQAAKQGKMVAVYYVGRLKSNNKQFDASQSGQGFKFKLGKGEVIRGWDLGVEGMKVGGKRRLTIPAQLAYGKRGAPPDIPPNATLLFDVELRNVS